MEKIVTKIGDVTIQRRAKPQQQSQPAVAQQIPPPQQQYQHFQQPQQSPSHPRFPVDSGNPSMQQHAAPFKNFPAKQEQIRQNLPLNKNVPRSVSKNVNFGGVSQHGGTSDLMPGFNPKKPVVHPPAAGTSQPFRQVLPQQRISDPLKNQESLQKLDSRFQLDDKVLKMGVNKNLRTDLMNKESGVSNKIANPPVRNQQIPLKLEQTQRKDLKSEPDISKYSGISIERTKKVEPQPQELSKNPLMIPGVNVQRVPASVNPLQNLNLNSEFDEEYSDYEEDFEEAPSDEDFDEANFPDPNFSVRQNPVPVEKKQQIKPPVQYPLENTRQMPKPQPQPQPSVKNAQPPQPIPQPHKNIPILEKFKQSGLTIEKRKPPEVKKLIDNFNIPGIDIQRLGKTQNQQNVKQAPEKFFQEDSNEDDDKQFEGYESDLKEGEDYDEYYENESEEFEEEAVKSDMGKMPNIANMPSMPNIPGVSFEKRKRPDINLEELAKQSGISIERRKDPLENLAKKPKPAFQNKSPIVLSSEDDEKNEEESPEEKSAPVQQQVQKKPEPNLPPGISIQKRKPSENPEKKPPSEIKLQKNAEELRFMSEDDEQAEDYQLEDEDDFEDDLDPNLEEEYNPSQYDANFENQVPAPKPPNKPKIPGISNADLERFVQRSGITIEKKSQQNQPKESEDFENYDENPEQFDEEEGYDDMEGEGEYDEMEDEAYYNEEENPDAFANPSEDLQMPEEDMSKVPELEEEGTRENLEEKEKIDESKDEEKETDINDMVCKDLVELIQKGEIEGEIEDDKDEEDVKKDDIKRKAEETEGESNAEEEGVRKSKRKKKKKNETDEDEEEEEEEEEDEEDEEDEEEGKDSDKNIDKSKITSTALRKNIREVMDETKLDESTIAAQRQEAERLKRLQEQQRIIREVQKQIQMSKQNEKSQNKVLSLLQGNTQTSILKTSSAATPTSSTQVKVPNHVLVKLSNGQQTSLNNKKMMELLKTSKPTKAPSGASPPSAKTLLKQGMVTPSVSIAPLIKKEPKEQQQQQQPVQPPQQQSEPAIDEKKKKKGDVVTLSSDSEDDCIVLSEEDESEPEEDPTNSGMHTSDKYNVPDEQGRVVVNVGHPDTEEDLYLAPQIARIIKPHQIGGIRFLYDNVIESVERFSTSSGFGCILAHSMGLGKTLQIVSFSDIFLRYTSARTILVIMPINTIQNWLAEFNMWLPKENKTDADIRCREFDLYIVNESLKNINSRSKVILDWHKNGGVLLMGYELFRLLSLKKSHKSKKKRKSERDEKELDSKNKELIEEVYGALVRPGPDLVICDEGHRIKNSHATTSQALKQIRTRRRIVLTGYPLQNNLLEYWCMVDFVRPNYLGSKTEFSNMFERPIQNGQCIDSTPQDKRLMRYRAHVLHSLLEGFVQRRSHAVLQNALPEKEEYVLLLRFTPFQRKLYDTFMNEVVRTVAVPNPLKAFAVCCKIWNHPDVLYNFLKKKGEEIDLDLEEALPPSMQPPGFPYGQHQQENPATQFNQVQPVPQPWPKRGPGSRGGKIRQIGRPRVGRGGRKPAASIPPNLNTNLPPPEKPTSENENFNSGQFPSTGTNFNPNASEHGLDANRNPGGEFSGRNYNQNQFGSSNYNEYSNQSNYQSNSNFNSKNPLDNLEDISSGNFQNKRFFDSSSNTSGNQSNFPNQSQNFESSQNEQNFSQTINNSPNDSNMNASFESNLNSSDSTYNQNDSTKSFDYNPEYNQEFFPGENFQNSQQAANFPAESKPGFTRDDGNSNSNSYFQGSNTNNANFDYQSTGSGMGTNFQSFNRPGGGNFPNSNSGTPSSTVPNSSSNFQGNVQNSNFQPPPSSSTGSEFIQTDFQGPSANFPCSNQNNQSTNFQNSGTDANYQGTGSNYMDRGFNQSQQGYWSGSTWVPCSSATGDASFIPPPKYGAYEGGEMKTETKMMSGGCAYTKSGDLSGNFKTDSNSSYQGLDEKKINIKMKDEEDKKEDFKSGDLMIKKEDSLPYDWATDLFKNYVTGVIENSSKMEVFFHIVNESIKLGDRLLVFSQSLLTLDLIEDYLQRRNVPNKDFKWAKHRNYFRLDGSTPGLEREKLINEFNSNTNVYLFLVSTRAGSLGINLVGANRVVVFDASWNPCHDTQAVCRVYRYGQQKPCFVYRLVMDNCLEKKIYDRQINKQGMADRVVDELNPDAHLSIKEVTNLCWDDQEDTTVKDFSHLKDKYNDEIIKLLLNRCSKLLSKEPFQHESLLIDRKEKKLSQAEKRLAKRSYELEKQAANQPKNIYSFFPNSAGPRNFGKPIASVRPMQSEMGTNRGAPSLPSNRSRWIPAEVWQKQGMSAQEMTLPLDVVIPTNSPDKTSIVLKAGQRVMVLKSPKGIYMQLENGKIIAIRTAFKVGQNGPPPPPPPATSSQPKPEEVKKDIPIPIASTLKNNPNVTISPKVSNPSTIRMGTNPTKQPFLKPFTKGPEKKIPVNLATARSRQVATGKAKPFTLNRKFQSVTPEIKQRLMAGKMGYEPPGGEEKLSLGEQSGAEEGMLLDDKNDDDSFIDDGMNESSDEKPDDKLDGSDSLATLRKVTERISVNPKQSEDGEVDPKNVQMSSLKKYRHNFTSHVKNKSQGSDEGKNLKDVSESETEGEDVKGEEESTSTQQGNENVQNWLMNQSYPPMDPYGNYFPGYYGYGPGPAPMMPPYDGFYPGNYGHPMGRNSPMVPPPVKQETPDNSKTAPQQTQQPIPNPNVQNVQNVAAPRNSPVLGTPPMYPPYPNPYPYPYNYPANPGFNNQGYPYPPQTTAVAPTTSTTTNASSTNQQPPPTQQQPAQQQMQQPPYDNSMYSAFHRPDGHFQGPENPYPPPYPPRPPYPPNSGTPGFFPYNAPYPNYPYGNFNPYMHPPGYGYPMQNPPPVNNPNNSNVNNSQPSAGADGNSSSTNNNNSTNNS